MRERMLLAVVLVSGCGAGKGSEESLLSALPSRQLLGVSVPAAGAGAAARVAANASATQTAGLYVLTRETTAQVNAQVGGVLDTLSSIVQSPPSATGAGSASWGPLTDALSPVAWRLVVKQLGAAEYGFQLDVRPKAGSDADFQTFLQGASKASVPGGPSQGTFSVDFDVAHVLDPLGTPLAGQLVAAWNAQSDRREVHLHLTDVHAPAQPPASADVGAVLFPDGSGAVSLDAQANLVGNADQLDVGQVGSRWNSTGAGRGDAKVHEADGGLGAEVTECWDASFNRVYFRAQTSDGGGTEGDPAACVFAEPLR